MAAGDYFGVVIRQYLECDVDVPPDPCFHAGSAFTFVQAVNEGPIQHRFIGLAVYTPKQGTNLALRRAVADMQQRNTCSGHPFMGTAQNCAADQRNANSFDKTLAALCIYTRAEGGLARSVMVLVGTGEVDEHYLYVPMGMVLSFQIGFQRRQHGEELEDVLTVIVQL